MGSSARDVGVARGGGPRGAGSPAEAAPAGSRSPQARSSSAPALTPLTTWFAAAWYVTNQKFGASALGLQRVLGLGSYATAWTIVHKLRRAMVRPDRDQLSGLVEVDETYVDGEEKGVHGRFTEKKAIVAIALELHEPRGYGRVRLA